MRLIDMYESAGGRVRISELGQLEAISSALDAPEIKVSRGSAPKIKAHIEEKLASLGWATNVRIEVDKGPALNAFHFTGVALQVQAGNIARAFYDLLKLEAVVQMKKASLGVLIVPTNAAAKQLGDNLANFERITSEHRLLFADIIRMPLIVMGFE